jgi:hypothetical protein
MSFFGDALGPLWSHTGATALDLLQAAALNASTLLSRAQVFDAKLVTQLETLGGAEYATVASLAYRQVTGGIASAWNDKLETPYWFMKEISSDGDVSTVDVIFPAAPFFVFFNPELLKQLLRPVLAYANNETDVYGAGVPYNLAWAPHHLGHWPVCNIKPSQQEQMPIEETGNMMLMLAAIAKQQGTVAWLDQYWSLLAGWGDYLVSALPDPGDQLCTDDFEGPSPHNSNLALKGIAGIGAYAVLLHTQGDEQGSTKYANIAATYAMQWSMNASDASEGCYRLQYNLPGTWSLKYNALFHQFLGLHAFNASMLQTAEACYGKRLNKYGVPLDDRATFTKGDWMMWVAAMGTDDQFTPLAQALYDFCNESPDRVPLSDWYDTKSAKVKGFRARPVVGGFWAMPMMKASWE